MKKHIVALTTCHNRIEKTLLALDSILSQETLYEVDLDVIVVDDGSIDNTAEIIREHYPFIQIIRGNGNLYWAGGMIYGWKRIASKIPFDTLLVFNDDIIADKDALDYLIKTSEFLTENGIALHTVSAAFKEPNSNKCSYGGFLKSSTLFPLRLIAATPNGKLQRVDTINMNLTLIPRITIDKIGFLSECYSHSMADIDYGFRVNKAGGENWLTGKTLGYCRSNEPIRSNSKSRVLLIKQLLSPKAHSFQGMENTLSATWGVFWPISVLYPYIKVLVLGK